MSLMGEISLSILFLFFSFLFYSYLVLLILLYTKKILNFAVLLALKKYIVRYILVVIPPFLLVFTCQIIENDVRRHFIAFHDFTVFSLRVFI
jgi:hypothetical protein